MFDWFILFVIAISLSKTEVLYKFATNTNPPAPIMTIDGARLANVDTFKYMGSTISQGGSLDKEIDTWICKANQALGRIHHRVLNQHRLCLSTKLKVYNARILLSLLCGCKMWNLYHSYVKRLENFYMQTFHSILEFMLHDCINNFQSLNWVNWTSIKSMLIKTQD